MDFFLIKTPITTYTRINVILKNIGNLQKHNGIFHCYCCWETTALSFSEGKK